MHLPHDHGHLSRNGFQIREFNRADLAILQRYRFRHLPATGDGAQPKQLPAHHVPRDLFPAVRMHDDRFERARTHGVQMFERVTRSKQHFTAANGTTHPGHAVQAASRCIGKAFRQAELTQEAGAAPGHTVIDIVECPMHANALCVSLGGGIERAEGSIHGGLRRTGLCNRRLQYRRRTPERK